jgi:tetratricopeptide (TPR) repeat protein
MIKFKQLTSAILCILFFSLNSNAQLKTPAPSPTQTLDQAFALSNIKIEYSRPSIKGRIVFGELVPFGKVWRTGANASTKITFGDDVKIEGMPLAAGTYAMYSIPNKDSWDIMFYKDVKLGGDVANYKVENEVLKVKVKPTVLANKVEAFTMNVADITATSANIELTWEQTRVAIKITAEIDATIMKNIETLVVKDSRPYSAAATYYYDNDKDLKQALEWANKAFEANPKAYWTLHLKAKIQLKMKDYVVAIATAEQSKALATADKDDAYIANNDKLIAEAKKGGK